MTPERWEQITGVFQSALARDESAREEFLDDACGGDRGLREEIDALLAAHGNAGRFGDEPVRVTGLDASIDEDGPPDEPSPAASAPRFHPFLVFVALAAVATIITFGYAGWFLIQTGGTTRGFGWTEVQRSGGWYVRTVDPSGPASGRLEPGDRLITVNGVPPLFEAGTMPQRRESPEGAYEVVVERNGLRQTHTLPVISGPNILNNRLTYFFVSLVWAVVGLFIGAARPDQSVAQLASLAALAVGHVFIRVGVIGGGPVYQPLHMVLGYHFFTRFPTGRAPRMLWRAGLWFLYATGTYAAALGLWMNATMRTLGMPGLAGLITSFPVLLTLRWPLGLLAGSLAGVGMVAIIPYNYRRLTDEDQRRRVRWVMYSSFICLLPQLWWSAVALYEMAIGPSPLPQLSVQVNALTVVLPLSVAYAVVKHRVFDISVVVRRGVQYLLATRALQILVALPVVALAYTVVINRNQTIAQLFTDSTGYLYWIAAAALALRYRRPIQSWFDRRFFHEEFDREQMLMGLVDDLGKVDSISRLSELVNEKLELALHPDGIYVWYRDPQELADASSSNPLLTPADFPSHGPWLSWLEERAAVAELPLPPAAGLSKAASRWLTARGVALVVPIADSAERLAGLLLLGAKKSEEPYSATDRRLLQAVAKQTAVVRENLRLRAQVNQEQRIRHDVLARLDGRLADLLKECPVCGACYEGPAERCDRDGQPLTLSLPIARTIDGKYRLDQLIGKGGMGAVYEARDLRLERPVALKVLLNRSFGQQTALRRFRREARAAAQLNHPNIVGVYDYGPLDGEGAYIVMERVHGVTLRAELQRVTKLPLLQAAEWFDQLLSGLAAAHVLGIVHRDLKPENLIARSDQSRRLQVKILDFGLAKIESLETAASGTMTAAGVVMGTVGYMSPEQVLGQEVDHRTDIFAVGVMLAETLTGQRPFQGEIAPDVTRAVLRSTYHLPFTSPAARAIDEVLQRCIAKDAGERYSSAGDLRAELIPSLRACAAISDQFF